MRTIAAAALVIVGVVAFCVIPSAQALGAIEGNVKDKSGSVLPGVTVLVAGREPIERAGTAVTDGTGRYRVADVGPGSYAVTFSLPGFTPVTRAGVEVTAGLAATVDVEMRVGAVQETFTIPGNPSAGLTSRPFVLCGLTVVPADPKLDAKMRIPLAPGRTDSMRTVAPQICASK